MTNKTENEKVKTKWSNNKIPRCKKGKNHKWKGGVETAICLKCGYDVFDMCYKDNQTIKNYKSFDFPKKEVLK